MHWSCDARHGIPGNSPRSPLSQTQIISGAGPLVPEGLSVNTCRQCGTGERQEYDHTSTQEVNFTTGLSSISFIDTSFCRCYNHNLPSDNATFSNKLFASQFTKVFWAIRNVTFLLCHILHWHWVRRHQDDSLLCCCSMWDVCILQEQLHVEADSCMM